MYTYIHIYIARADRQDEVARRERVVHHLKKNASGEA